MRSQRSQRSQRSHMNMIPNHGTHGTNQETNELNHDETNHGSNGSNGSNETNDTNQPISTENYDTNYEMYKMSEENLLSWFDGEVEKKVSDKKDVFASNANNIEPVKDDNTFMKKLEEKSLEIESFNESDFVYAPFKF